MPERHQIQAAGCSSPHEETPSTCCHFRTGPAAQLLRRLGVTLPVLRLQVEVEEASTCNHSRTWANVGQLGGADGPCDGKRWVGAERSEAACPVSTTGSGQASSPALPTLGHEMLLPLFCSA